MQSCNKSDKEEIQVFRSEFQKEQEGREKMMGKVQGTRKWCRLAATALLVFLMVCCADVFAVVSQAASGKANSNAKIRKEASTNSAAMGSITKGTEVEITGETKGTDGKVWYSVTVNGTSGYIRSDLVDKTESSTGSESNTGSTPAISTEGLEQVNPVSATISGGNTVRVRTSASTANSNNILTTAANGTKVTVVGRTTGSDKKLWYQIKLTVNGNEVIGYVRNDYLTLSGEVTPLTEENITPPEENNNPTDVEPSEETNKTAEPTVQNKRYETKLLNDKWYLLDYEENKQFDLDQIFAATKDFEEKYLKEQSKNKGLKVWLVLMVILAIAGCGAAGFLFYRNRELNVELISNIESSTQRRTADRPRNTSRGSAQQAGRERPAIKDGMEARREDRGPQNGQRQTGNRAQQNAQRQAAAQVQNAQRQATAQPQNAQRQAAAQTQDAQRQAAAQTQNAQRQAAAQAQNIQRPVGAQVGQRQQAGAPMQNGQRSSAGQMQSGARPMQQRPQTAQPQQRATAPSQAQHPQSRAKNFAQEDEREFEFLNWDSDDE